MDHERSRHPRYLGFISLEIRATESLTAALLVEQGCQYPTFQQLSECTLRRNKHLYMTLLFFSLFTVRHRRGVPCTVDSPCTNFCSETSLESRVISTTSFQKQVQSYSNLAIVHGSSRKWRSLERRGASKWWNLWTQIWHKGLRTAVFLICAPECFSSSVWHP